MQGEKFVGALPGTPWWSDDGRWIHFRWNPEFADTDSLYRVAPAGGAPEKVPLTEQVTARTTTGIYSRDFSHKLYTSSGDLYALDVASGDVVQITNTLEVESDASYTGDERGVVYRRGNDLYLWDAESGSVEQLTDFRSGREPNTDKEPAADNERWIKSQERRLFTTLEERLAREERREETDDPLALQRPLTIYTQIKHLTSVALSPDTRFVTFILEERTGDGRGTVVPSYVTEEGFTEDLPSRTNVGAPESSYEFNIYDRERDTVYTVSIAALPGIFDRPAFLKDYSTAETDTTSDSMPRAVYYSGPFWSPDGAHAALVIKALDFKDRWIVRLDCATGALTTLDRQHDDAWIGGLGIHRWMGAAGSAGWLADNRSFWFQSEASGYSHLYVVDVTSGEKRALTSGKFEVDGVVMNRDRSTFYFISNERHPGDWQLYRLAATGGLRERLTDQPGSYLFALSPDESQIALKHSTANRPWELFVMDNKPGAEMRRLTYSTTEGFDAYPWREPEIVTFTARDDATVYARLYRPDTTGAGGPAVVFVHGAGYLQNAHMWRSQYYREFMFHNILADNGYTVLDIDY
ncbi:MAG TPA: DPP IV N-terminal domain-containing protein, partial [candidate division Zixibacteria bacterium]|nr:DPP IV N-terminal domain-containing protein [candidate division Zixibacteria bacterium]